MGSGGMGRMVASAVLPFMDSPWGASIRTSSEVTSSDINAGLTTSGYGVTKSFMAATKQEAAKIVATGYKPYPNSYHEIVNTTEDVRQIWSLYADGSPVPPSMGRSPTDITPSDVLDSGYFAYKYATKTDAVTAGIVSAAISLGYESKKSLTQSEWNSLAASALNQAQTQYVRVVPVNV